jgi:hypothetical protein
MTVPAMYPAGPPSRPAERSPSRFSCYLSATRLHQQAGRSSSNSSKADFARLSRSRPIHIPTADGVRHVRFHRSNKSSQTTWVGQGSLPGSRVRSLPPALPPWAPDRFTLGRRQACLYGRRRRLHRRCRGGRQQDRRLLSRGLSRSCSRGLRVDTAQVGSEFAVANRLSAALASTARGTMAVRRTIPAQVGRMATPSPAVYQRRSFG